jgi:hypothetical protein
MNEQHQLGVGADVQLSPTPSLPTYHTVADVLEKKNGSGLRLAGWTVARTLMIAPPFLLVGVPWKQAFGGAAISSALISLFTLIRISDAAQAGVADRRGMYIGHAYNGAQPTRGAYR